MVREKKFRWGMQRGCYRCSERGCQPSPIALVDGVNEASWGAVWLQSNDIPLASNGCPVVLFCQRTCREIGYLPARGTSYSG